MISRRNSTLALAGIALTAMFSVASVQAQTAPKVKLATSMGDIVVQLDRIDGKRGIAAIAESSALIA